jgi:acetyltransferase-like isoleucine patch superfamily enzyme
VIGPSLFAALRRIDHVIQRLKTRVVYGPFLGKLGRASVIRRPILVSNPQYIEIGDDVLIREGSRLEVLVTAGRPAPKLQIGSSTNIEQNVHIVCHHRVIIGPNVSITANCAIVDTTHPFEDVQPGQKIGARIADDDAFVEIGEGAFIGIGTVILPNVRIGAMAVIGANSVVTQSVPEYCCAAGAPARVLRSYRVPGGAG